MRTLSLNMRNALAARESGNVPVFLLTIRHPSTVDIMRVSSDPTQRLGVDPLLYGTVSRGDTFYFIEILAQLPDEKDGAAAHSSLSISNVDRALVPLVRSIDTPPQVLMEVVLSADPDTVEISEPLDILHVEGDAARLTFDLGVDGLTTASFPAGAFTPGAFPGLFA